MELSAPVPLSRGLASISDDGELLATAKGKQLEIRSIESMETVHAIELSSAITCLSWGMVRGEPSIAAGSTDTHNLVIAAAKTGEIIVDVFVGEIGLCALSMSPHGYLLAFADSGIGATVVNVMKGQVTGFALCTKTGAGALPLSRAHSWAPGGRFIALVTRCDDGVSDAVVILDCKTAQVVMCAKAGAQLGGVEDVAGVRWIVPTALLVWGAELDKRGNSAMVLLASDGRLLRNGAPKGIAHNVIAEDFGLGIKTVAIAHSGRIMAVGGWDGILRLSSTMPWRQVAQFDHSKPVFDGNSPPAVFREKSRAHRRVASSFELMRSLDEVEICVADGGGEGKELKCGVALAEFSGDGELLASTADSSRNVLFIWEVAKVRLFAVLVLLSEVARVKWAMAPDGPVCVIVAGGDHVYVWKKGGAAAVKVDEGWQRRSRRDVALRRVVSQGGVGSAIVVDAGRGAGGICAGVYFV